MRVLVLGHNGMLGHMVCKYFFSKNQKVKTISNRWPSKEFKDKVINFCKDTTNSNYIINCIAAIPQKKNNFDVNVDLPIWLDDINNLKLNTTNIIYPGTDMDKESCKYGSSKRDATEFIINKSKNTKIIRSSVIGPEIKSKKCVFEWFMNSKDEIYGWSEHYWNGVTTLEWAKICNDIISNWNYYEILNTPATDCISKYDLLCIIKEVFNKSITIKKNSDLKINRCLIGNIKVKGIKQQLIELKEFYYDN